jgi:predicted ArsR family transcriptional regulator
MKSNLEINDRRFLEHLHRLGPSSVQDICQELDITATAVRQRLVRLQNLDLVSREVVHAKRGRPHHKYYVTHAGRRNLGDNYESLAPALWASIMSIEESDVRQRVIGRIRMAMVSRYGRHVDESSPLTDRLEQLRSALESEGYQVECDHTKTLPILRETNCPYLDLAQTNPEICKLECDVFAEVLDAEVHQTTHCLDGHYCCEFQVCE